MFNLSQSLVLKVKGLFTSSNELSAIPEGALLEADNIDISHDDVATPRRGYERLASGYATSTDRTAKTWFYQDKQFAHKGTSGTEDKLSYFNSGAWTDLSGTFTAPTGFKLRTAFSNENMYFTTSAGVYKLGAYNGTPVKAGAYKGLDIQTALSGSSGFLVDTYYTAYRILWGYTDANNNLILGSPSARSVIQNNAGGGATRDVAVTFSVPSGVTTSWIYQIYRSTQVTTDEPSDEMQLVFEGSPTSGEISAGTVTVNDITIDSLRGAFLYTSASQQGLSYQNEQPPLATDMAMFRDCMFYANVVSKHRVNFTLLAIGGTNGLAVDDTVTVGGVVYTGKASETIASAQFKVFTSGSASQNIRDTATSLVKVINRHTSSTVYAFYMSNPDQKPGIMMFEERSIGGAAFTATSSRTTCWNPSVLPTTSSNDSFENGLRWSKPYQPEAVALPNRVEVSSKSSAILKIVPLRDALIIFKEDGIHRLTGYYPNFTVESLDSSARIIGGETPSILNNQIFCLTDQGVTVVGDSVKIISRPIEEDLLELFGSSLSLVRSLSWGIGYESARTYALFLPSSSADTYCTQAYVYNVFTNAWTRYLLSATCGVVESNHLYLGDATSNFILKDRKSYTFFDYADYGHTTTITAISGTSITISSGADLVSVGDILYQSSSLFGTVTAVNTITSTLTVESNPGFTLASADVLKGIPAKITWAPITQGNVGVLKQYNTASVMFKSDFNGTGYLKFKSDMSPYFESAPIAGLGNGTWGLFDWGSQPWGGEPQKRSIRQWVPRAKQRCSQLTISFTHSYGFSPWQLVGISLFGEMGSERTTRG